MDFCRKEENSEILNYVFIIDLFWKMIHLLYQLYAICLTTFYNEILITRLLKLKRKEEDRTKDRINPQKKKLWNISE